MAKKGSGIAKGVLRPALCEGQWVTQGGEIVGPGSDTVSDLPQTFPQASMVIPHLQQSTQEGNIVRPFLQRGIEQG